MNTKYLRAEDVRRLERFAFTPRTLVEGRMAGRHRSTTAGPSTEFRDYRLYVPGDDVRQVDWRVFARTDRYYLRTHNQETNAVCHILLDSSNSMGYGDPDSKLDYASRFAAALSYLVVRNKDTVSLQLFDEEARRFLPPGSTTAHLQQLLLTLEENVPTGRTSLAAALERSLAQLQRRGALIVLSDFFDDVGTLFDALNPYLHRGFEVYLYHILAPTELELPDHGLVTFQDMESNGRVIAHTRNLRAAYRQSMQEHIQHLRDGARRRGVTYSLALTNSSYFHFFDQLVQ